MLRLRNPKLKGPFPLVDLVYDLEVAKERQFVNKLSGTYILPDDTVEEIKNEMIIYNN